jgi:hypothetical protein
MRTPIDQKKNTFHKLRDVSVKRNRHVTAQVFIFTPQRLRCSMRIVQLRLESVHFSGDVSIVLMGSIQFCLEVGHFALPVINNFIKSALTFFRLIGQRCRLKQS